MEFTKLNELLARQNHERSLVANGKITEYLQLQKTPVGVVEIAIDLQISCARVRNEINLLVEAGLIKVSQNSFQNKLSSGGLVYSLVNYDGD